jgi:hypothetical protein
VFDAKGFDLDSIRKDYAAGRGKSPVRSKRPVPQAHHNEALRATMGVNTRRQEEHMVKAEETLTLVDIAAACIEAKQHFPRTPMLDNFSLRSEDFSVASSAEIIQESSLFRKIVSFDCLEIREYNVTVGDHPCCTSGFPLTLDWDYAEGSIVSLDEYEESRCPRRSRAELKIAPDQRCEILSEDGYSPVELRRAERKLHRARSCSAKLCERVNAAFFREEQ